MRNPQGYTLLELCIVLTITSIMALLAIPALYSVTDLTDDTVLQAQLVNTIHQARIQARARRMPITICKSANMQQCGSDWSNGLLVFIDVEGSGVVNKPQDILAAVQLHTNTGKLFWRAYPYTRHYLRFLPYRWMSVDNGTFWYCHRGKKLPAFIVTVNNTGVTHTLLPNKRGEIRDSRNRVMTCQ